MSDDIPEKKKLGLTAPRVDGQGAGQSRKGVRVRGGKPIANANAATSRVPPRSSGDSNGERREWKSRPPREGGFGERREWTPRPPREGGDRPFEKREWTSRPPRPEGGASGERREWTPRPPREGGFGERREWTPHPPRVGGDRSFEKREWTPRPPRPEGGAGGERREWTPRPPREGGFGERREWTPRPPREGGDRSFEKREWTPRPPRPEGGAGGERREWTPRPPREGGFGERREWTPRPPRPEGGAGGERREWTPRPPREGGDRPFKKREWAPRPPRPEGGAGGERREWTPRPPREGGSGERREWTPRPPRDGGARPFEKREWKPRPAVPERDEGAPMLPDYDARKTGFRLDLASEQRFFVTCPRGLEGVLETEIKALNATHVESAAGGIACRGPFDLGYKINLESRVASRVMWRITQARYQNEDDIYKIALNIDWPALFDVTHTFRIHITAIRSPLASIDFAALRVKDAIADRFRMNVGSRPSVNTSTPDMRVHCFLTDTFCVLYLDLSGESLFKRGYREEGLAAPLRENLAAGILRLIGWTPDRPLFDPMCGSGTFLTEAAMIAANAAPGLNRRFAFERMPNFEGERKDAWLNLKGETARRAAFPPGLKLFGADVSSQAIEQTREHLSALGADEHCQLQVADVLDLTAPTDTGTLICNPPYGVRLGDEAMLAALYPKLGSVLKNNFPSWNAYFITADHGMPEGMRLHAYRRTPLKNGALDCRLFGFKMVAGSNREPSKDVSSEGSEVPTNEVPPT